MSLYFCKCFITTMYWRCYTCICVVFKVYYHNIIRYVFPLKSILCIYRKHLTFITCSMWGNFSILVIKPLWHTFINLKYFAFITFSNNRKFLRWLSPVESTFFASDKDFTIITFFNIRNKVRCHFSDFFIMFLYRIR